MAANTTASSSDPAATTAAASPTASSDAATPTATSTTTERHGFDMGWLGLIGLAGLLGLRKREPTTVAPTDGRTARI